MGHEFGIGIKGPGLLNAPAKASSSEPLLRGVRETAPALSDHTLVRRVGTGRYGEVWLARYGLGEARTVKVIYRHADPAWMPLLTTPAHPVYPSGHSTTSSTAPTVLAVFLGENSSFTVDSDVMLGVTRAFTSLSAAQDEIRDVRIFGAIHFRTTCEEGRVLRGNVGSYVLSNANLRVHSEGN
jgi:hypothetical protein